VEELRREALAQAIVWLPTVAVALSLLLVFFGIVAGLGLTRFALYRPFDVGDRIDVSGLSGRVITVNLRVLVPNSKMLTDPIKVAKPSTGGAAG
jgi:hypothetical protein